MYVCQRIFNRCRLRSRSGSKKGEEGPKTVVAVAVDDESGSNFVRELPPRSSSARGKVPFIWMCYLEKSSLSFFSISVDGLVGLEFSAVDGFFSRGRR
ncbi:hypothetical protein HA466_0068680 [Hirschfeldia incana]|nr:hypothetical protein HA466_0068680 [Hirschfeldia incana]